MGIGTNLKDIVSSFDKADILTGKASE